MTMKNYLHLLCAFLLVLNSCKKEEQPAPIDLLNNPLETTSVGFTGNVNGNNYYILTGSQSVANGSDGLYTFAHQLTSNDSSIFILVELHHMRTYNTIVNDDEFYFYFKKGGYQYYQQNTAIDLSQNKHYAEITYQNGANGYTSIFGPNATGNYFTLMDTLHTTYQNKTAIKYRAKFECMLYNLPQATDTVKILNGVIVGMFVKP